MQIHDPGAALAPAAALTLASVAVGTDWHLLGVPTAVWFACGSGALWGATWFEHERKVAKAWAIATNFGAGVVLSSGLAELIALKTWAHAMVGFVSAAWPVFIATAVRDSIVGALSRILNK